MLPVVIETGGMGDVYTEIFGEILVTYIFKHRDEKYLFGDLFC